MFCCVFYRQFLSTVVLSVAQACIPLHVISINSPSVYKQKSVKTKQTATNTKILLYPSTHVLRVNQCQTIKSVSSKQVEFYGLFTCTFIEKMEKLDIDVCICDTT